MSILSNQIFQGSATENEITIWSPFNVILERLIGVIVYMMSSFYEGLKEKAEEFNLKVIEPFKEIIIQYIEDIKAEIYDGVVWVMVIYVVLFSGGSWRDKVVGVLVVVGFYYFYF